MTVETTLDRQTFPANGAVKIFPFNMKFFTNSQVFVYLLDSVAGTSQLMVEGTDYTLSGQLQSNGGVVTFAIAPASSKQVFIQRIIPLTQTTSIRNQGAFLASLHEDEFDTLTMQIQQANAASGNSLQADLAGLVWDAKTKKIINAAEPVNAQDVTTKNWVTSFISGLQGAINTAMGVAYLGGSLFDFFRTSSNRTVDSIAALRALLVTQNQKAFVLGYYAKGDGGGGAYYVDTADTTSLDNGGSIIVATDGGRWKLASISSLSVKQFGAKGDGANDDTLAIQKAYASLGGGGRLCLPKGIYNYTSLIFDGSLGLHLVGDGPINTTILRCTSTLATDGCKFRSVFDCTAEDIHFDHSSTGFTGYLCEMNHKPSSGTDTQGMVFNRCTFASMGYNLYTAKGVNLDQATLCTFTDCKFGSLLRPIDGQNPAGGSYSNAMRFKDCQMFDNVGFMANYPGEQWTFDNCNIQAGHDGAQRVAYSVPGIKWNSLNFINCGIYDATAGGTSYLQLDTGSCLNIMGGTWGGRSDLASSTLLNATGVISGVNIKGGKFSRFTNLLVAGVAGNSGWDISGGNRFEFVGSTIINPQNVDGISFDLNSPNSSRGILPNTDGANSLRYNQDGSMEITGSVSGITAGSTVTIPFHTAFPVACWEAIPQLQSPASTTSVISFISVTKTGVTVFISGTGTTSVRYSAKGK